MLSFEDTSKFFGWMQGYEKDSDGLTIVEALDAPSAFEIIMYLRDDLKIVPNNCNICDWCEKLINSNHEGTTVNTQFGEETLCNECLEEYKEEKEIN